MTPPTASKSADAADKYTPTFDKLPAMDAGARRILLWVAVASLLSSAFTRAGGAVLWPNDRTDALAGAMDTVRANVARLDTLASQLKALPQRVTELEVKVIGLDAAVTAVGRKVQSSVYIGCETLKRVNPPGAVPPEDCR